MLCVIPYCHLEVESAFNLLCWHLELGGCKKHDCLLVAGKLVSPSDRVAIQAAAEEVFNGVETIKAFVEYTEGWPKNANAMFTRAFWHIALSRKCPFWWNECDCVALKPGWLDALADEYKTCGKPYMGCIVQEPLVHLTGCAIYPPNIFDYAPDTLIADKCAFDAVTPHLVVAQTHHTKLFQHLWTYNCPPNATGKYSKDATFFNTAEDLKIIRPEAAIFHRNKRHCLIERLRERIKCQPLTCLSPPAKMTVTGSRIASSPPTNSLPA